MDLGYFRLRREHQEVQDEKIKEKKKEHSKDTLTQKENSTPADSWPD
jgi:hypothetical protein